MAELCRKFGVSRPTGYAWVKRFRAADHDVRAVEEKSRRPHSNPHAISAEVEDLVVQARKLMPRRGPRKLRAIMVETLPREIDVAEHHFNRQHSQATRPLPAEEAPTGRTADAAVCEAGGEPNDTWCIDFKGKFRMQDGNWCHVLTLMDADTRYLLRAEPMLDPTGSNVEKVLDSAFKNRPAQGDALRQRAALRLQWRRPALAAFGLVAQARHRARADRARQPAAEWPSRALPSHARRGGDAVRRASSHSGA